MYCVNGDSRAKVNFHNNAIIRKIKPAFFLILRVKISFYNRLFFICGPGGILNILIYISRQILCSIRKKGFDLAFKWYHRILLCPIHRPFKGMFAKNHLGMSNKIFINQALFLADLDTLLRLPLLTSRPFAFSSFLKKQNICNNFGARAFEKGCLRQSDCSKKIRPCRNIFSCPIVL